MQIKNLGGILGKLKMQKVEGGISGKSQKFGKSLK